MAKTLYNKLGLVTPPVLPTVSTSYTIPARPAHMVQPDLYDIAVWRLLQSTGDPVPNSIEVPLTITAATNASPIVITTSTAHGLTSTLPALLDLGSEVWIKSAAGNTAADGIWKITVLNSTQLSLNSSTGNGSYTGGGKLYKEYIRASYSPVSYVNSSSTDPYNVVNPMVQFPGVWPDFYEGPWLQVTPFPSVNGGISLSWWIYKTSFLTYYEDMVRKNYPGGTGGGDRYFGAFLENTQDGAWTFFDPSGNSTTITSHKIKLNQWNHVGITWDGVSTRKAYLNGELVFTDIVSGSFTENPGGEWMVGGNVRGLIDAPYRGPLLGQIDDIRVANALRPLSYFASIWNSAHGL